MLALTQHNWSAVTQDNDRGDQVSNTCNQLKELGHETLINSLDVLGKTVHDSANWLTLEPPHGSMDDTLKGFGVECTAGADATQQECYIEDDYKCEPKKCGEMMQRAHRWREQR